MGEIDALEARLRAQSMEWLLERTVGIYATAPEGNPRPCGTGVLLQIADATFLVTAAHVMSPLEGLSISLDPCSKRATFVPLGAKQIRMTRDEDAYDFAYARMSAETARALTDQNKKFVRLGSIGHATPGRYCVVGIPMQTIAVNPLAGCITTEPVMFETYLYEGPPPEPFTPGATITLQYDENTIECVGGERPRIPTLAGISGCGIWQLYPYNNPAAHPAWDPSAIRRVGIEHRLLGRPYKAVVGVGIEHVLYQIACAYPELAPSIRLTWRDMPPIERPVAAALAPA